MTPPSPTRTKGAQVVGLRRHAAAGDMLERAQADAVLLGKVTQHWFRHRMATIMLRHDPRATVEQGGWLDIRSVMGYLHDVPEHRRKLVAELDDMATNTKAKTKSAR